MFAVRALLVWLAIIPFAILNGALRDLLLVRLLPTAIARALSGITLSATILVWVYLTAPWLRLDRPSTALSTGAAWLILTIVFEFGFGRWVAGKSWSELFRAYTFAGGDLWPVVLLVVATAPWLVLSLRAAG